MADRQFKYLIIAPAILVLLLIGLFPLIYSLVVSFQSLTMTEQDTSFAGLANYAQLFHDTRLWQALAHTAIITVVARKTDLGPKGAIEQWLRSYDPEKE
jgi:multiple sugar transport system permease protein